MLDFSKVNDEQLLELLKAAMAESVKRGIAMRRAAENIILDAREQARIKQEAFEQAKAKKEEQMIRELQKQAKREAEAVLQAEAIQSEKEKKQIQWQKRKAIVQALIEWGINEDFKVNIWSRDTDRRVYIDGGGTRRWAWKICFYVTGNNHYAPGSIDIQKQISISENNRLKADKPEDWAALRRFLKAVSDLQDSVDVSRSQAENFDGEPDSSHLEIYRQALQEEVVNVHT